MENKKSSVFTNSTFFSSIQKSLYLFQICVTWTQRKQPRGCKKTKFPLSSPRLFFLFFCPFGIDKSQLFHFTQNLVLKIRTCWVGGGGVQESVDQLRPVLENEDYPKNMKK
jgi:hypothetical protein